MTKAISKDYGTQHVRPHLTAHLTTAKTTSHQPYHGKNYKSSPDRNDEDTKFVRGKGDAIPTKKYPEAASELSIVQERKKLFKDMVRGGMETTDCFSTVTETMGKKLVRTRSYGFMYPYIHMCMCVCVCVCVCMYICIYVYIRICICIYIYKYHICI